MASSSHLKEKSVEEILPHTQLAMFKPHEEGETIQASKVPTEKISTSKGYYKLSANDVKEIEERDEFYKHHIFRRQLRSKKEVYQYIRYGFVSKNSKEPSSSQAPLNIVPNRRREMSQKEEVEAFLADSWENLTNFEADA
nr:PREDICTED: uncharacterized protein LOC108203805 isoform X2 [Daucus carota subsp. sativus]